MTRVFVCSLRKRVLWYLIFSTSLKIQSSFYSGCYHSAVRNFTPFSRFIKETKSLSTASINKGSAKTLGVGCDNNRIPYLGQFQKGLVKLWYHHSISLMSCMTSKNFLIKVCPGSRLTSALHACEFCGRLWGVGTDL